MQMSGFGTVSCTFLLRLRNRVSACKRVGVGKLGSGFCSIAGFFVCLGRLLFFPEQDSDPEKELTVSPPSEDESGWHL